MKFHDSYGELKTDDNNCFLCGKEMKKLTVEHVFPKWLQKKYDLWNERLTLLNNTDIQYKNLKIPCCAGCNNESLSTLENIIYSSVVSGYEAAKSVDAHNWYLWAGKIFYGVLRKELKLSINRSNPSQGTIVTERIIKQFSNLHLFLQGIRGKYKFFDQKPYTVLICNLYDLGEGSDYFFGDDLLNFSLSIRMGEIGVIVTFQDDGLIDNSYGKYVSQVNGRKLHPIQFDELYAKVNYQVSLMDYSPYFHTATHIEGDWPAETTLHGGGYINEWNQKEFAYELLYRLGYWKTGFETIEDIFVPPDRVYSWMVDDKGEILLLKESELKIKTKS